MTNYNTWHEEHKNDDDLNGHWHKTVLEHLDFVKDIENRNVLEIACGRGGFANYLASLATKPSKIVACDYSSGAIEIAYTKYGNHQNLISWQTEDIQRLSFENNSFDTIISCETIEHLPDPALAMKELYRVLKPGGKVYLTCPNYFNLFGIWCIYRWLIGKPYTEGGQAYVNYALMPFVYWWIKKADFKVLKFHSSDIVLPIRIHLHFFKKKLYSFFRIFGLQTFYILKKS